MQAENKTENRTENKAENKNRKTKAMKTKNNVQKAILRSGAVVVSFVLISFTVSAQDFWKRLLTNSSFNEIAIAMVETSGKTETAALPAKHSSDVFVFYQETEPALELESWMTNTNYFTESTVQFDKVTEEPLELENWMLDENHFNSTNNGEKALELEDWMLSDNFWNS
jgi:hypothetical protein